jgi:hypothetical protein
LNNFYSDRDQRGAPLEELIGSYFHSRNIPFGFNPFTGTEDPRREDYDLYTGHPDEPLLWEVKMDWQSGLTGNVFVEEKSLFNSRAQKMAVGRLFIDVFDIDHLRGMYKAKAGKLDLYRHVIGGDQSGNHGNAP